MIVAAPAGVHRLLAGPGYEDGPEGLSGHLARLGPRPRIASGGAARFLEELERSGLCGRGGAAFPTARKWAAVASRSRGHALVVANGAEGEPASVKDRLLMGLRPHLVLDGLLIAAETVGAAEAVLFVHRGLADVRASLTGALAERRAAADAGVRVRLVEGPHRYVAGEESSVVSFLNGGDARPTFTPPRPFERGVDGRPTLVQNVETLAHAALVARYGHAWFRTVGAPTAPGSALVTVGGGVQHPGLYEVALGATVGDLVAMAGGASPDPAAVLVGGYAGRWLSPAAAWPAALGVDVPLGAGIVVVLPTTGCGLAETARALAFLARESARQCGPCVHGVGALAETLAAVVGGRAAEPDVGRMLRWSGEIAGRGACHHPDGASTLLRSALDIFGPAVQSHLSRRPCAGCAGPPFLPTPRLEDCWR